MWCLQSSARRDVWDRNVWDWYSHTVHLAASLARLTGIISFPKFTTNTNTPDLSKNDRHIDHKTFSNCSLRPDRLAAKLKKQSTTPAIAIESCGLFDELNENTKTTAGGCG